jgi:hypothetical protein
MSFRVRFIGATVFALSISGIVGACASTPDPNATTVIAVSPEAFSDYAGGGQNVGVQGFLAAKCGSLDCHGAIGESLRIFSQYGLRLVDDAGDIPGGGGTTPAEIFASYVSVISIQPELTTKAFHGAIDPHQLLLFRKPLGLERHKGGTVMTASDNGDICLTSWFEDGLDAGGIQNGACNDAATLL